MHIPPTASALELAAAIQAGELTSQALIEATLERIAALDAPLNAFVQLRAGAARREAARADRIIGKGAPHLPAFWGVPSALKDLQAVRGMFLRAGSRALRYTWTPVDGPIARRYRRGGVVLMGKTSTSELALMPVVEPDLHGPTVNPWNPEHTAGGSSGGSAAAVASGMLPIAQASDGAGSIRIPASFCHLFGFKASRGVLPPFRIDKVGLATAGPVAHTVADAAAMLDILRGVPQPARDPASFLNGLATPPPALRVRYKVASPLVDVDPEVAEVVRGVAEILETLGHTVSEGPPVEGSLDEFLPMYGKLAAAVPVPRERTLQPVTRWLRSVGRTVSWREVFAIRDGLIARIEDWLGDADLWLTPTVGVLPPKVGALHHEDPEAHFRQAAELGSFTAPFNISGQPAASIPAALSASGLPIGVQVVARKGEDALLFAVCRQLEQALDWRARSRRVPTLA